LVVSLTTGIEGVALVRDKGTSEPLSDAVVRALASQADDDDHDRSLIVAKLALTPEQRLDANTQFLRWYFSVRPQGPLIGEE